MAESPTAPVPAGWEPFDGKGFVDLVGPLYVRKTADGLKAFGFVAAEKHANLIGLVHGGMLMTLADRALGVGAWDSAGGPCVTIQLDMQFLSAVKMGEFAEISPELVRRTRSLCFMRGTMKVGERATAMATGVWKILDD